MRWRLPKYFPGWFVSGGGGSGGSGTVQTDGVTIQGDGSGGNKIAIKAVQTDTTLSGAGTVASPLHAIGAAVAGFSSGVVLNDSTIVTANTLVIGMIPIGYAVTFATMGFFVQAADGAHNSDYGLYNAAGTLVANIGAQVIATTGFKGIATVQGPQTIPPGLYYTAYTSNGSAFSVFNNDAGMCLLYNTSFGVSAGGALPASITPPAVSQGRVMMAFQLF